MQDDFITTVDCCTYYQVETSFIAALHNHGLISIIEKEDKEFVQIDELKKLEKYIRLHYDLNINFEGIEVVEELINRMELLQHELTRLKNRLLLYEKLPT